MLKLLENLNPDIIADFRKTDRSAAIKPEIQQYIRHMDYAAQIYGRYSNITTCAKMLIERFPKDNLALITARTRIYDAIEHFHLNSKVSAAAWDNLYADKQDELARLAIEEGDYKTAQKCFDIAHGYRTKNRDASIDPELLRPPIMIYSTDLSATDLGFDKKSMKDIAGKYEEGAYTNLINKLPITYEEKQRLFNDAGIITDAEIVSNDE